MAGGDHAILGRFHGLQLHNAGETGEAGCEAVHCFGADGGLFDLGGAGDRADGQGGRGVRRQATRHRVQLGQRQAGNRDGGVLAFVFVHFWFGIRFFANNAFRGQERFLLHLIKRHVPIDGWRFPHACRVCFRFGHQQIRIALGHFGRGCGFGLFLARRIDSRQADCIASGQGTQRDQRSTGKQVAFHSEIPFWNTVVRS